MSKHILLVDSSQSFTKFVEVVLDRLEYTSMTARSARDGLQILKGRIPDLIITEAVLPDMHGIDLCKAIKDKPRSKRIPIIVITVDNRLKERVHEEVEPFDEILTKPVSVKDLFDALQKHLVHKNSRKNMRAPIAARVSCRDGTHYRSYITLNIGEGGMFIESDKPLPVGEIIEPDLLLPGLADPLPLKGKVVYSVAEEKEKHPQGMGVKFLDIDTQTRTILSNYIQSYLSDSLPTEEKAVQKTG